MHCVFNCSQPLELSTFSVCKNHLKDLGLIFSLISMKSLCEDPRGIGPFFEVLPNLNLPRLIFKIVNNKSTVNAEMRSMYLPSFKKNHVILHCLGFTTFLGNFTKCATVKTMELDMLEQYKIKNQKECAYDNIIKEQTEAINILSEPPPNEPTAGYFLVDMLEEYNKIFRSSIFATSSTDATKLDYSQEIFTIFYPEFLINLMTNKYPEFNQRNTLWPGLVYHLYPETIVYEDNLKIQAGANCELVNGVGLVALRNIIPGEFLILKNKEMTISDLMCFLPATNQPVLKSRL